MHILGHASLVPTPFTNFSMLYTEKREARNGPGDEAKGTATMNLPFVKTIAGISRNVSINDIPSSSFVVIRELEIH